MHVIIYITIQLLSWRLEESSLILSVLRLTTYTVYLIFLSVTFSNSYLGMEVAVTFGAAVAVTMTEPALLEATLYLLRENFGIT